MSDVIIVERPEFRAVQRALGAAGVYEPLTAWFDAEREVLTFSMNDRRVPSGRIWQHTEKAGIAIPLPKGWRGGGDG